MKRVVLASSIFLAFPLVICRSSGSFSAEAAEVKAAAVAEPTDDAFAAAVAKQKPAADQCAAALKATMPLAAALPPGGAWGTDLSQAVDAAFKVCLGHYVRLQTINPPGDEILGASYLKTILEALGIPNQAYQTGTRWNIIATLSPANGGASYDWQADPGRGSLILYHHMDVVPVIPDQWKKPELTFSGEVLPLPEAPDGEKFLWGRGALDMKAVGVFQLLTMTLLKARNEVLPLDVHFIAAADEEVNATGARGLLKEMEPGGKLAALRRVKVLINEGGYGVKRNGKDVFVIATEEKGGAWLSYKHKDPLALMRDLHTGLDLLGSESSWKKQAKGAKGCVLVDYGTPGLQVNVVPSRGELGLRCPDGAASPSADDVTKAFKWAYRDDEHVKVETTVPTPGTYHVKIGLASSGHGSLGGLSALTVAASGLYGLGLLELEPWHPEKRVFFKYQRTPGIDEFVKTIGKLYHIPAFAIDWAEQIKFVEQKFLMSIGGAIYSERLFRTACSWTSLYYHEGQLAEALSDCRLVHTGKVQPEPPDHAAYFLAEVKAAMNDPALDVSVQLGWNYTASQSGTPAYKALAAALKKEYPAALVSSFLAPTSSDSAWFRAPHQSASTLGAVPSYGFFPVILADDLTGSIHGSNERMPVAQIGTATRVYLEAMRGLAGAP